MFVASLAVLSLLVTTALAQTSSFVPAGISAKCAAYLGTLDTNPDLATCTQPVLSALSAFSPTSNPSSLSAASITSFLQSFCPITTCSQTTVSNQLTAFYAACQIELTSNQNSVVTITYDSLYALVPFKNALCAKDDSGNYCAANLATPNTGSSQSQAVLRQNIYTTVGNNASAFAPNATTFRNYNIPFLFINPAASASKLCTACTKSILSAYISFESSCLYGPGLPNSQLLVSQSTIYANVTTTCGANFLNGAVQAAGGLSQGLVSAAAPLIDGHGVLGGILGLAALMATSL